VLIYPVDLIAKRWVAHERNVLPALARTMIETVGQIP
jgi:hypothetical protein